MIVLQRDVPLVAVRKPLQPDNKKHMDDEDDSFSIASLRRAKSGVTHGSAPTFKSAQRAEKRKEVVKTLSLIFIKSTFFFCFID